MNTFLVAGRLICCWARVTAMTEEEWLECTDQRLCWGFSGQGKRPQVAAVRLCLLPPHLARVYR